MRHERSRRVKQGEGIAHLRCTINSVAFLHWWCCIHADISLVVVNRVHLLNYTYTCINICTYVLVYIEEYVVVCGRESWRPAVCDLSCAASLSHATAITHRSLISIFHLYSRSSSFSPRSKNREKKRWSLCFLFNSFFPYAILIFRNFFPESHWVWKIWSLFAIFQVFLTTVFRESGDENRCGYFHKYEDSGIQNKASINNAAFLWQFFNYFDLVFSKKAENTLRANESRKTLRRRENIFGNDETMTRQSCRVVQEKWITRPIAFSHTQRKTERAKNTWIYRYTHKFWYSAMSLSKQRPFFIKLFGFVWVIDHTFLAERDHWRK